MINEVEKYSIDKIYLREFQFFNGKYDVTFNIVDIDTDKMIITLAVTRAGKISVLEYDLKSDSENELYFQYGVEHTNINIEDFED